MNEFFIYLEDITISLGYLKGWRIFKMTCMLSLLHQKTFQELVFKAFKNLKRCGLLSLLITRRLDWLTEVCFFSKIKLRFLRRRWQLWMEPTEIKQRYRIFFVMFCLSVLLLNSMSKLIHNRCTCKLVIKTLRLQTCVQTETDSCVFFMF